MELDEYADADMMDEDTTEDTTMDCTESGGESTGNESADNGSTESDDEGIELDDYKCESVSDGVMTSTGASIEHLV